MRKLILLCFVLSLFVLALYGLRSLVEDSVVASPVEVSEGVWSAMFIGSVDEVCTAALNVARKNSRTVSWEPCFFVFSDHPSSWELPYQRARWRSLFVGWLEPAGYKTTMFLFSFAGADEAGFSFTDIDGPNFAFRDTDGTIVSEVSDRVAKKFFRQVQEMLEEMAQTRDE